MPEPHHLVICRLDALPAAQPTVSTNQQQIEVMAFERNCRNESEQNGTV